MRIFNQLNAKKLGKSVVILTASLGISVASLSSSAAVAPVFTTSSSFSVAENSTAVGTINTDKTGETFELLDPTVNPASTDRLFFAIDTISGELTITPRNFESPQDNGGNNIYNVVVRATDIGPGFETTDQLINVTITDVNEAPVITSNGGGDTAAISVDENATAVTTVTSDDVDAGATETFSIRTAIEDATSVDADLFIIDAATGVLTMTAQDFETPVHDGNTLVVVVRVSDGENTDDQTITVTITDVNEAPVITSNGGGDTAAISVD
jgi:serralysin